MNRSDLISKDGRSPVACEGQPLAAVAVSGNKRSNHIYVDHSFYLSDFML